MNEMKICIFSLLLRDFENKLICVKYIAVLPKLASILPVQILVTPRDKMFLCHQ